MNEAVYYKRNLAIINYTKQYCVKPEELVSSEGFHHFLDLFFNHLACHNIELYNWLFEGSTIFEVKDSLVRLLKLLLVLEPSEIVHPALKNRVYFLQLVEEAYHFWRNMERYSIIYTRNDEGFQIKNFLEADDDFNR